MQAQRECSYSKQKYFLPVRRKDQLNLCWNKIKMFFSELNKLIPKQIRGNTRSLFWVKKTIMLCWYGTTCTEKNCDQQVTTSNQHPWESNIPGCIVNFGVPKTLPIPVISTPHTNVVMSLHSNYSPNIAHPFKYNSSCNWWYLWLQLHLYKSNPESTI